MSKEICLSNELGADFIRALRLPGGVTKLSIHFAAGEPVLVQATLVPDSSLRDEAAPVVERLLACKLVPVEAPAAQAGAKEGV